MLWGRLANTSPLFLSKTVIGDIGAASIFRRDIGLSENIPSVLLTEARAARAYWKKFGLMIGCKAPWFGRAAHRGDAMNKFLDIGYHYLVQKVSELCHEVNLPAELGIFHRAQSGRARPLAYDFMEPLRTIMVDDVLLKLIRKKKKLVVKADKKLVAFMISGIKRKGESRYYHRNLGYCITLDYWLRLLLLEFMSSVNSGVKYQPIFPSMRRESRCRK